MGLLSGARCKTNIDASIAVDAVSKIYTSSEPHPSPYKHNYDIIIDRKNIRENVRGISMT